MITLPTTIEEMTKDMLECEQTQGQSVYQHGESVQNHFFELINGQLNGWRIPKWLSENPQVTSNIYDVETIKDYTLYHDCGKPYCRIVDADGRTHFPNHAEVSGDLWMNISGDEMVGFLIKNDMLIHTATADEISSFLESCSTKDILTLLIVSLCEIHSNAKMFGGIDSNSFKSKWKKIDRRGNQIVKHLKEKNAI